MSDFIEMEIHYVCPRCASDQVLVIDQKDQMIGSKIFHCANCGEENEVIMETKGED